MEGKICTMCGSPATHEGWDIGGTHPARYEFRCDEHAEYNTGLPIQSDADSKYYVAKMEEDRLVNTPLADVTEHEMDQLALLASRRSHSPYNK